MDFLHACAHIREVHGEARARIVSIRFELFFEDSVPERKLGGGYFSRAGHVHAFFEQNRAREDHIHAFRFHARHSEELRRRHRRHRFHELFQIGAIDRLRRFAFFYQLSDRAYRTGRSDQPIDLWPAFGEHLRQERRADVASKLENRFFVSARQSFRRGGPEKDLLEAGGAERKTIRVRKFLPATNRDLRTSAANIDQSEATLRRFFIPENSERDQLCLFDARNDSQLDSGFFADLGEEASAVGRFPKGGGPKGDDFLNPEVVGRFSETDKGMEGAPDRVRIQLTFGKDPLAKPNHQLLAMEKPH